jgi:hypothetical protein
LEELRNQLRESEASKESLRAEKAVEIEELQKKIHLLTQDRAAMEVRLDMLYERLGAMLGVKE